MDNIRIAAVVCGAQVGSIDANLDRTVRWVQRAAEAGVDIVCFPELNITGYSNGERIAPAAQPLTGQVTETLKALSTENDMAILAGMAETHAGGKPFATHLVITPAGGLGAYRKLHLAPPEQNAFSCGNTIPVFTFRGVTFGIGLCYDTHFPELATMLTAKGADIIFFPHASPRGDAAAKHRSWMRHLPARAFDNSVFIVACNQVGPNGEGLVFPGNAVVLSPAGEVMASALSGEPQMLVADLEAATLAAVRSHPMRYFFPNRRTDLYSANSS